MNEYALANVCTWLRCSRDHFTGQECPHSPDRRQYRGQDQQKPVHDTLLFTDLLPEDLQIEGKGENDADGEAQERAQEGHDPVERREDDGQDDNESHGEDADHCSHRMLNLFIIRSGECAAFSYSTDDFKCGYYGPGAISVSAIFLSRRGVDSTHFSGTFVSGMIEMKTIMQTESACGYSSMVRMLAVISSRTTSPNMSQPRIAMEQSRENC